MNFYILGITFLRISIGILFMLHGYPKIIGGPSTWIWYGQQMSIFGIYFFPLFWGFCAAVAEFFGGLCLAAGLATRLCTILLGIVMIVALGYHFHKGDPFMVYSHAITLLCVLISLFIIGGGRYSLDAYLNTPF